MTLISRFNEISERADIKRAEIKVDSENRPLLIPIVPWNYQVIAIINENNEELVYACDKLEDMQEAFDKHKDAKISWFFCEYAYIFSLI